MRFSIAINLFFVLTTAIACNNNQHSLIAIDTPTSGEITIAVDESFEPVLRNEMETFCELYDSTKINLKLESESNAISDFQNNIVSIAIVPRKLNEEELKYFRDIKVAPYQIKIGTDAIALIINRSNPDSNMLYQNVIGIFDGSIRKWNSMAKSQNNDSIIVVFDNNRSSTIRFLNDEVLSGRKMTNRSYAVNSNSAVISYVEKNPNAIGVISVNHLSNLSDSTSQTFLDRIRVVGISNPDSANQKVFYKPNRYSILYQQYPFIRDLYLLNREPHIGLGTGFATYLISEEGQLIIHRAGLAAAKQPHRVIEIKNEF